MTSTHESNGFPRSRRQWAAHFRSSLEVALEDWSADCARAEAGTAALRAGLGDLADPQIDWSDPAVVERLVRAAAFVEAFSMLQPTPVEEDPRVGVNLAASMFKLNLRENRRFDCSTYLATFPARIASAVAEMDSSPEESAHELAFCASMAVSALR